MMWYISLAEHYNLTFIPIIQIYYREKKGTLREICIINHLIILY